MSSLKITSTKPTSSLSGLLSKFSIDESGSLKEEQKVTYVKEINNEYTYLNSFSFSPQEDEPKQMSLDVQSITPQSDPIHSPKSIISTSPKVSVQIVSKRRSIVSLPSGVDMQKRPSRDFTFEPRRMSKPVVFEDDDMKRKLKAMFSSEDTEN